MTENYKLELIKDVDHPMFALHVGPRGTRIGSISEHVDGQWASISHFDNEGAPREHADKDAALRFLLDLYITYCGAERDHATRAFQELTAEKHADFITCPKCGKTSPDPNDIKEKYCGMCHQFHKFMELNDFDLTIRAGIIAYCKRLNILLDPEVQIKGSDGSITVDDMSPYAWVEEQTYTYTTRAVLPERGR